jgi:hypothetical protein
VSPPRGCDVQAESLQDMFDAFWLALTVGLFGIGLAYLAACDRV